MVELAVAQSKDELDNLELRYVNEHECMAPTGYNLREGGQSRGAPSQAMREAMRQRTKKLWASDEYRQTQLAAHRTDEYVNRVSKLHKDRLSDPIAKEALLARIRSPEAKRKLSEASRAQWKKPDYREKVLSAIRTEDRSLASSESIKRLWANGVMKKALSQDDVRARHREALTRAVQRPERKEKLSEAMRARWADDAARAAMLASLDATKEKRIENMRKAYENNPELREKAGERSAARWKDPEFRQRMLEQRNSPEAKAKRAERELLKKQKQSS
jgi:hypothetical protein